MAVLDFVRSRKDLRYLIKQPDQSSSNYKTVRSTASSGMDFRERLLASARINRSSNAALPRQWSEKTTIRSCTSTRAFSPRRLPPRPACFGREKVLSTVVDILNEDFPPVLVLYGAAGIGKTTVALASLDMGPIKARYGSNRIWVDCSTALPGLEGFLDLIFIGMGQKTSPEPTQTITQLFKALDKAEKIRPLIVLDHFESIWDRVESREEVEHALDGLAELVTLLITSKHLEFPVFERGYRPIEIRALDGQSARQTFLHWRPQFANVEKANLDRFLCELDYYPLAIRLVASATSASDRDVRRLKIRWKEEQARWSKAEDEQASALDLAISYSLHSRLLIKADHAPKRLYALQLIASVPDGLSAVAMEDLLHLKADELNLQKALDGGLLTSLISEDQHSARYRMLAPIREYILSRYPLSSQQRADLHDYYLCFLEGRSLESENGHDQEPTMLQLMEEEVNLDFVISDALHSSSEETCLRAIWMVCYGPIYHSADVVRTAAKRAGELSELPLQINCLRHLVANRSTNLKSQYKNLETATDIFHKVGTHTLDRADCMEEFGDVLFALKWPTSAKTEYLGALKVLSSLSERARQATILFKLGQLHFLLIPDVNFSESLRYFNEALAIQRDLGDSGAECDSFVAISECFVKLENFDAALSHLDRAILLSQTVKESVYAEKYGLALRRLRILRLKGDLRSTGPLIDACIQSFCALELSLTQKAKFLNELGHLELLKGSNRDQARKDAILLWDCSDFLTDYSLFEPSTPAELDFSDLTAIKQFVSSHCRILTASDFAQISLPTWCSLFPLSDKDSELEIRPQAEYEKSGTVNRNLSWYQRWLQECIHWHNIHKRFGNANPWWEICKLTVRLQLHEARLAQEKGQLEDARRKFEGAGKNLGPNHSKMFGGSLSEYYPEDERIKCEVMAWACTYT
ncbi:hypothetical protein CROQUDRAFT_85830 [Cronartium quercuum f. sp. fusiforme G11]|uniref:AAA+ ATPase domain-containing protein n=1 Tax=Cronartium quercuum f. sp. fusiforme G11 TaxID=708437 RepID=A0A9P6NXF7_9BASI|nr:hypothetical protein CROQUDRAFT_85830 [Cronartium quercuum f. sp. fusiforme G11]